MGYRENWFNANKGKIKLRNIKGTNGYTYKNVEAVKCVRCGEWFPVKSIKDRNGKIVAKAITIDHIIPKRNNGLDIARNLQPMCSSCNSSKRDRMTTGDTVTAIVRYAGHPLQASEQIASMAGRGILDAFGVKYKRR